MCAGINTFSAVLKMCTEPRIPECSVWLNNLLND